MTPLDPATVDYLRSLKRRGVVFGLDRMRGLVRALGNPQDRVPVIHVAGTNGKGSVAAMLEAIFRAAGWRTGLYTSPHLIRLGERIQVDREPISGLELAMHARELRGVVEQRIAHEGDEARPSYFEFMTALAFLHFARSQCDIAIVEVGMGGRLDATNVVTPEVAAITSISLDHTEFLGSTLEAIAAEKAGIVKDGRPVVIGRLPPEAERVVRATAVARSAHVLSVRDEFGVTPTSYPHTNLAGEHQRINAAIATIVARQFDVRWRLTPAGIETALQQVNWPARWQRFEIGGRRVIVDASHNAEGATMLERGLTDLVVETRKKPIVVVGVLGAARAKPLLETIGRHASEIRLVVLPQTRACSYDELQRLVPTTFRGLVIRDTLEKIFPAPERCLPDVPSDVPLVVTGSIYLAGEALARINPSSGPVEHDLQDF